MMYFNGKAITVEPPMVVELKLLKLHLTLKVILKVVRKPATLESGAVVQIPFHILKVNH